LFTKGKEPFFLQVKVVDCLLPSLLPNYINWLFSLGVEYKNYAYHVVTC